MLNEVPMRGEGAKMPPTDPLIYRLYELVMINGPACKASIEEEFGDGIMFDDTIGSPYLRVEPLGSRHFTENSGSAVIHPLSNGYSAVPALISLSNYLGRCAI